MAPPRRSLLSGLGPVWLLRGMRTGNQPTFLLGAVVTALTLWRRRAGEKRELLYREELREGSPVMLRFRREER